MCIHASLLTDARRRAIGGSPAALVRTSRRPRRQHAPRDRVDAVRASWPPLAASLAPRGGRHSRARSPCYTRRAGAERCARSRSSPSPARSPAPLWRSPRARSPRLARLPQRSRRDRGHRRVGVALELAPLWLETSRSAPSPRARHNKQRRRRRGRDSRSFAAGIHVFERCVRRRRGLRRRRPARGAVAGERGSAAPTSCSALRASVPAEAAPGAAADDAGGHGALVRRTASRRRQRAPAVGFALPTRAVARRSRRDLARRIDVGVIVPSVTLRGCRRALVEVARRRRPSAAALARLSARRPGPTRDGAALLLRLGPYLRSVGTTRSQFAAPALAAPLRRWTTPLADRRDVDARRGSLGGGGGAAPAGSSAHVRARRSSASSRRHVRRIRDRRRHGAHRRRAPCAGPPRHRRSAIVVSRRDAPRRRHRASRSSRRRGARPRGRSSRARGDDGGRTAARARRRAREARARRATARLRPRPRCGRRRERARAPGADGAARRRRRRTSEDDPPQSG